MVKSLKKENWFENFIEHLICVENEICINDKNCWSLTWLNQPNMHY